MSKQETEGHVPFLRKAGKMEITGWNSSIHLINSQKKTQSDARPREDRL